MTGIKRHTFAGLLTAGLLTGITAIVTAAELTSLERMERAAGAEAFRKAMAAKEKDNAAYLNNLRIAVDKGTPAAILEDADRLLLRAGGRVNNYDMIRQRLERLSRQTPDSDYFTETQLAEVRYFLGVANEHGMGSAIDRISATRNYLLAAHLNMDARIALGRLFFFQDTVLHGEKTKEIFPHTMPSERRRFRTWENAASSPSSRRTRSISSIRSEVSGWMRMCGLERM